MDLRIGETREEVPFPHPLLARCATVGRGGDGEATASTVAKINGAM